MRFMIWYFRGRKVILERKEKLVWLVLKVPREKRGVQANKE